MAARMSKRARASLSAAYRRANQAQADQAVLSAASAAAVGALEGRGVLPPDLMGFDTKLAVGGALAALALSNQVRGRNRGRALALATGMLAPVAYEYGRTI